MTQPNQHPHTPTPENEGESSCFKEPDKCERCGNLLTPAEKENCTACIRELQNVQNEGEVTLKPTLSGTWRHSHGQIFCGTLRIARGDFDTDPSPEFCARIFDAICNAMNTRSAPQSPSQIVAKLPRIRTADQAIRLYGCIEAMMNQFDKENAE